MEKRAMMRIVEAVLAIMIVLAALLIINFRIEKNPGEDLNELASPVLKEIAKEQSLRAMIISESAGLQDELNSFVEARIDGTRFGYEIKSCDLGLPCEISEELEMSGEIFGSERVISSSIESTSYNPKKIKSYLWRKF